MCGEASKFEAVSLPASLSAMTMVVTFTVNITAGSVVDRTKEKVSLLSITPSAPAPRETLKHKVVSPATQMRENENGVAIAEFIVLAA